MKKNDRKGETYTTKEGYEIEIIEYFNAFNSTIKFKSGYIMKNITYNNIKNGRIKYPYNKSVYNVGFIGVGRNLVSINSKATKVYEIWHSMIERCYNKKSQIKNKTYIDCSIDETWHNFQIFAQWYEENKIDGFDLDKDILIKGNKVYGPNTCCFVPQEINKLFIKSNNLRGKFKIGVHKYRKRFVAQLRINNVSTHIGVFDTELEAFEAYKKAKESEIKKIANLWKNKIDPKVYNAMMNYEIEQND